MALRFLPTLLVFIFITAASAAEPAGGLWGAWLESTSDARNTALAGANVGLADDVWASRSNPAGLGQLVEGEARFTYAQPFADVDDLSTGSVGVARPITGSFTPGTFALNISYLYAGGIEEADYTGKTGRTFADSDMEILIGWGKGFGEDIEAGKPNDFFVGTSLKIYSQTVGDYRGKGFGMDVGILSKPLSFLRWGVNMSNLIPPGYRVNQLGDLASTACIAGTAIQPADFLLLSLEGSIDSEVDYDAAAGLEIKPISAVSIRGGYRLGSKSPCFGTGLRLGKVGLDYAGVLHPDLGLGHRLTLDLWF